MKQIAKWSLCAALLPGCLMGQVTLNGYPSRGVGQLSLLVSTTAPNLVEGKEMMSPDGIAVDTSSSPPILYVADSGNNRVLAWKNAQQFTSGAPADLVIGQPDKFTTNSIGPLNLGSPTGLAVDKHGNLFVADCANNRILRYPSPFNQPGFVTADLVLGQNSLNTGGANTGGISASTLAFTSYSVFLVSLVFDAQGNLWVTDAGNHRVLRYPASVVSGTNNGAAADLVLGQPDFSTAKPTGSIIQIDTMNAPSGLAFDASGRMFVTDSLNRVLVYSPPFFVSQRAARIIAGTNTIQPGASTATDFNLANPQGVFTIGNAVFVIDSGSHRILQYQPYDQWATATLPPPANTVWPFPILTPPVPNNATPIGQDSYSSKKANKGLAEPGAATLNNPTQAVFAAGELYIVDTLNNRVVVCGDPTTGPAAYPARRVAGQLDFMYNAPNLIDGREMYLRNGGFAGGGIAVDTASNPPRLYVADTLNNRVLGFKDLRNIRPGDRADLVIGQPDFWRAVPNYPNGNVNAVTPSSSGLNLPTGLAIDANGDLWVADYGNGRVVRFPKPFDQPSGVQRQANLVIGQPNFTTSILQPTQQIMSHPFGLTFSADGHLFVSDAANNRVLLFRKPATGFVNGMLASNVIGQPNYTTTVRTDTTDRKLSGPGGLATDQQGRLYVCDTGNGRVVIYDNAISASIDPSPIQGSLTGLSNPYGIFVNQVTGDIWVANTGAGVVAQFPSYDQLPGTNYQPSSKFPSQGPLSVALDSFGDLVVAESVHRVVVYYPGIKAVVNAANYNAKPIAPLEIASLFSDGLFSDATAANSLIPVATMLADTQVLVNGTAAPLFYVSPNQINFVTPRDMSTSASAEVQVMKYSTGQIRAVSTLYTSDAAPGLFTADASGLGQLAAVNEDGTINSYSNAVARGHYITFYGTGQGYVNNAPADGYPPTGAVSTSTLPTVYLNGVLIDSSNVQYSGLAPGFVGLWQINVKVPANTAPGYSVPVVLGYKSQFSGSTSGQRTTISVK